MDGHLVNMWDTSSSSSQHRMHVVCIGSLLNLVLKLLLSVCRMYDPVSSFTFLTALRMSVRLEYTVSQFDTGCKTSLHSLNNCPTSRMNSCVI